MNHLQLAHMVWENTLKEGDDAIDATSGNGHDSLFIAKKLFAYPDDTSLPSLSQKRRGKGKTGRLLSIDIQKKAIDATKELFQKELPDFPKENLHFQHSSHETFQTNSFKNFSPSLIVYNLGYLPGSDQIITTKQHSSLQSITNALKIIKVKGLISITCYPGHEEGAKESELLYTFAKDLPPHFKVQIYRSLPEKRAPFILFIRRNS